MHYFFFPKTFWFFFLARRLSAILPDFQVIVHQMPEIDHEMDIFGVVYIRGFLEINMTSLCVFLFTIGWLVVISTAALGFNIPLTCLKYL